ncbi:hypothetical protein [Methylobacterium durans]|uniref:hypothetical protein n=1 Tax=Methylobacterium durans TaxID=2202825 RepID=UPI003C6D444C
MMGVYLFDLASQHARYRAVRQGTIAGNVAHASTPDHRARAQAEGERHGDLGCMQISQPS